MRTKAAHPKKDEKNFSTKKKRKKDEKNKIEGQSNTTVQNCVYHIEVEFDTSTIYVYVAIYSFLFF